jgi:MFS family permease
MRWTEGIVALISRLARSTALRRVLLAFLLFTSAEYGTWVAILLYAYERTGPASVGLVALIQLVPAAVFAPAAASLGDRFPRERVLAFGYLIQALAMAVTAFAMAIGAPVVLVYGAAVIAATSVVTTRPTQSALLPSLAVAPQELTAANGASGVVEGAGLLLGPLLAGAIVAVATPAAVFLAAAIALLVGAVAVFRLRPTTGLSLVGGPDADAPILDASFGEGLRTVVADPDARLVVGLLTARQLMVGTVDVLFVLLALDLLAMGEPGAGLLSGALGAGAILGGALTFRVVGRNRLAAVAAAGAALWGLAMVGIAFTASPWLAPILVVAGGAGLAIVDIAGRTMLQRSIRDEVLARVFGLQEGLAMAGLAIGSIIVPVVVGAIGLVGAVVVTGAFLPVLVGIWWRRLDDLDRRAVVPVREIALLRRSPLFRPLPAPQLEAVARRATWLSIARGTSLIREGEPGDRFYVLASGVLGVARAGRHLRDVEVVGDGVGEIALLRGVPRTATVRATTDASLLAIDRAPFLAAVTGHPAAFAAAEREVARRAM